MISILDIENDNVVKSKVLVVKTDYKFALEKICPLINNYEEQRNILSSSIYKTLERDLKNGCIVPPLTMAYIINKDRDDLENDKEDLENYINQNIDQAFILDGIQRLSTLKRAYSNIEEDKKEFFLKKTIYLNILLAPSKDKLLYRMITLNNGQKPMTARHQIEILANQFFNFEDFNIEFSTEKNKISNKNGFKKEILVKGYLAFSTKSSNLENQKIIDEMMDQLIMKKIIESNFVDNTIEFNEVVNLINKLSKDDSVFKNWIKLDNNFIGFCAGITNSYEQLNQVENSKLDNSINEFEKALQGINISKVKLGIIRRKAVEYFIKNYLKFQDLDYLEIIDYLLEII